MTNYKDKKVIIFGLGSYKNGSGISAAKFLIVRVNLFKNEFDRGNQFIKAI